ncbi:MAG TPA: Uma2 family endonuclease [Pyrinomonadaceae bacterium]|jgi:Uma2 family endonuclease|nr:Uma2 family endonuclease [Pyrinomonadaceae bacterium]
MSVQFARQHHFTVSEYERMGQTGVFAPDARVELIEGEIIEMSPIGSPHAACVELAAENIRQQVRGRFLVRTQNPIVLDDFSEPQPDIAVLKLRKDFYRAAHPRPEDVLLVVEVSDTTLQFDRQVKIPLYARAGIPEALIFSLPDEHLEYYSQPETTNYRVTQILKRGEQFKSVIVKEVILNVDENFG